MALGNSLDFLTLMEFLGILFLMKSYKYQAEFTRLTQRQEKEKVRNYYYFF